MSSSAPSLDLTYSPAVEQAISEIEDHLVGDYGLSRRAIAMLALQGDEEVLEWIDAQEGHKAAEAVRAGIANNLRLGQETGRIEETGRIQPENNLRLGQETGRIQLAISMELQEWASNVADDALSTPTERKTPSGEWLGQVCASPVFGLPILVLVVYFGLYQFVGVFGGGTVVNWLENGVFGTYVNPYVTNFFAAIVPWESIRMLFVGEYGIITLGVTYAIALILPLVTFYFLVFAVLEDSGYLPRLAMLVDRVFKKLGLNGRAVIPIVLGFGCDTMATIVTRILETKRERIIATVLLSLTIPCSAQLAVIMSLLAMRPAKLHLLGLSMATGLLVWASVLVIVFLFAGFLAARLTPGKATPFFLELPPMRWPSFANVVAKTLSRLHWYFLEVFPLFIWASVMIWIGQITGLFAIVVNGLEPLVRFIGLPNEAATAFLFGFFRRDYGAAGLMKVAGEGGLTGTQIVVACVTLTLFLPCVAQFLIVKKERGWKMAIGMALTTFVVAISVGAGLSRLLAVWTLSL